MAHLLRRELQIEDRSLTQDIVGNVLLAALVLCLLWFAALVISRPMRPIIKQAPDTHWVVVEGRAEHAVV
jgi:hypothetical protein